MRYYFEITNLNNDEVLIQTPAITSQGIVELCEEYKLSFTDLGISIERYEEDKI